MLRNDLPGIWRNIQVVVANGRVTLEAEVAWNHQREAAENAVRSLKGVRRVRNLVRLVPEVATGRRQEQDRGGAATERGNRRQPCAPSVAAACPLDTPSGIAAVNAEVTRQAATIAYLDDFRLLMAVAFACMPAVLLLRRSPRRVAAPRPPA